MLLLPCNRTAQGPAVDVGTRKQLLVADRFTASRVKIRPLLMLRLGLKLRSSSRTVSLQETKRLSTGQTVLEHKGTLKIWYTARGEDGKWSCVTQPPRMGFTG